MPDPKRVRVVALWARSGSVPSLRVNTYYFMKYSLPDPAILLFADRKAAERLQHDFWPSVLAICDRQA